MQQQPSTEFCFFLQSLSEFWNTCTRPTNVKGYGFNIADTDRRARGIERFCTYMPDMQHVYADWRQLVVAHSVMGIQVHDAKLAAGMRAHGITHILTLNKRDFARYSGITAITPSEVIQTASKSNP